MSPRPFAHTRRLSANTSHVFSARAFLLLLVVIFPCLFTATRIRAQTPTPDVRTLERGTSVARELKGGETHTYRVALAADEFLHAIVDQRGVDVEVLLTSDDDTPLAEMDSPNGINGPEPLAFIAQVAGDYKLIVRSLRKEAGAGAYELKIEELRRATAQDADRVAAYKSFADATRLSGVRTPEGARAAIAGFVDALPLLRAVGYTHGEASTLNMIALLSDQTLDEKQQAIDYYLQALPIRRRLGDRAGEAATLNGLGRIFDSLGEKQRALDYFAQALASHRATGDRRNEAHTLTHVGRIHNDFGEWQKALDHFDHALTLRRTLANRLEEAISYDDIGSVHLNSGQPRKAIESFDRALALKRTITEFRDGALAFTLTNLGRAYDSTGDRRRALDYFNQALELRRKDGDRLGEAQALGAIGAVYDSLGDARQAFESYEQSLALSRAVRDARGEATTLHSVARIESRRGDLPAALARIEAALELSESFRTKILAPDLRAAYFASVRRYHELHINLLMRLHERHPTDGFDRLAFQSSERSRARSLLELLAEARADIRQGVDSALLERERLLRQRLAAKAERQTRLFSRRQTAAQAALIASEIGVLTTEYEAIQAQIRRASPRYAALTQPAPADAKLIGESLDPDTVLLEFTLGEESSYAWAVTRASIKSFVLPPRAEIEKAAREYYALLTARNERRADERDAQHLARVSQADAALPRAASELSRLILAPVGTELNMRRVIVVADGALQYVPFGSLPEPSSAEDGSVTPHAPLVARREVVNLPSASTLALLRVDARRTTRDAAATPPRVAVFADPVFDTTDARVLARMNRAPADKRREQVAARAGSTAPASDLTRAFDDTAAGGGEPTGIPRLPFSRREAEAIAAIASANRVMRRLDFQANRQVAAGGELKDFQIIHFATHGLLNSRRPELSGIVLSLVDEQGQPIDGFLRLNEIYNLNLPAELVVLSACQTALGREVHGEGLVGLARGFMYAGARRIVASLWKVNDAATAELMKRFYTGMLKERLTPAAALRQAQNDLASGKAGRRFTSPYFWAAFTLQGEPR